MEEAPMTVKEMMEKYGTLKKIAECFLDDTLTPEELECLHLKFNKMSFSRIVAGVAMHRLDRRLALFLMGSLDET